MKDWAEAFVVVIMVATMVVVRREAKKRARKPVTLDEINRLMLQESLQMEPVSGPVYCLNYKIAGRLLTCDYRDMPIAPSLRTEMIYIHVAGRSGRLMATFKNGHVVHWHLPGATGLRPTAQRTVEAQILQRFLRICRNKVANERRAIG